MPRTFSTDSMVGSLMASYPNDILFTMDVHASSLYSNTPIQEGITTVLEFLKNHLDDTDTPSRNNIDIHKLLYFVFKNNYFCFGNEVFQQTLGVVMGNCLAPIVLPQGLLYWRHIWSQAAGSPGTQTVPNQLCPTINLSLEHSGDSTPIPLLDTSVSIGPDGSTRQSCVSNQPIVRYSSNMTLPTPCQPKKLSLTCSWEEQLLWPTLKREP